MDAVFAIESFFLGHSENTDHTSRECGIMLTSKGENNNIEYNTQVVGYGGQQEENNPMPLCGTLDKIIS